MHFDGIVGYCRVSTQGQVENGDGLEVQRNRIVEHCKANGLELEKFYEDRGVSGAIKDRPGLLALLKDCESGRIKRIVIYKQDRLARELGVWLWLETQFQKYSIELTSILEPDFDTADPMGKALSRIISVFAELERDVISMRLRDGRINCARNGERGSGPVAFGYKKVGDKLELETNESQWVQRIFRWKVKGISRAEIVRRLSKAGVTTKRGKPFSAPSLQYVLENKFYFGESNFGDVTQKGIHESIISKRLFLKAQQK